MDFAALLASLLEAETMPENWSEQLTEAYELDLSVPAATIDARDARIAELEAEVVALKVRNYELLEFGASNTEDDEESTEQVDEDITTEDLFTDPEED